MEICVNNDRKVIRNGGRKAPIISMFDLEVKIESAISRYCDSDNDEYGVDILFSDKEYESVLEWLCENRTIRKDLGKISFDYENLIYNTEHSDYCEKHDHGWIGPNELPNGVPFWGFCAGGDWEVPVYFAIYYDGKKLRGYIPTYGNTFDPMYKSAFGSEDEEIPNTVHDELLWFLKGIPSIKSDIKNINSSKDITIIPNVEWMIEDMNARIEIV